LVAFRSARFGKLAQLLGQSKPDPGIKSSQCQVLFYQLDHFWIIPGLIVELFPEKRIEKF